MGGALVVTVFGSSRPHEGDADYEEARILGRSLAKHGFFVCSGGYGGVMEAVSRGAKEAGGKTFGVTAEFFKAAKLNAWIDVEVRRESWEERLFELIRRADGFVACKGGTGTLVELAVVCGARTTSSVSSSVRATWRITPVTPWPTSAAAQWTSAEPSANSSTRAAHESSKPSE